MLASKLFIFCHIAIVNVEAMKPMSWWKEHVVMLIHGLIHGGRLQACPSCLLGLMYVFRVSTCWRLYKRPSPSLVFLIFLEFLCQESFLHSQIGFLDVHNNYCTATVYIHYMFFLFLQFNSRKTTLCCLILKATDFFWLWVFEFLLLLVTAGVVVVTITFGGSLCCYTSANQ